MKIRRNDGNNNKLMEFMRLDEELLAFGEDN